MWFILVCNCLCLFSVIKLRLGGNGRAGGDCHKKHKKARKKNDGRIIKGRIIRFFVLKVEQLADFLLMFQQAKIRKISGLSAALSVPPCLCGLVLVPMPGFVVRVTIYFLATKRTKKNI